MPDGGLWLSADLQEGLLIDTLHLVLVASELKAAEVTIKSAPCPYPWTVSGSLYVKLIGSGIGSGNVESDEEVT